MSVLHPPTTAPAPVIARSATVTARRGVSNSPPGRLFAKRAYGVLLRHPWAAPLIESRTTLSRQRLERAEAVIGTLRRAGFSIERAYRAQLTVDSYVYGFSLQKVHWPFESAKQSDVAAMLRAQVVCEKYPYLTGMLDAIMLSRAFNRKRKAAHGHESDFEFGLDLILDGTERLPPESTDPSGNKPTAES